jgi:hypothetical protein
LSEDNEHEETDVARQNVIDLVESFIEQIQQIRKTLLSVSISAVVLAPLAIGLAIFLLRHPSFFAILDREGDFGIVLTILLATIISVSLLWLITGIRQYRSVNSWNKRYEIYLRKRDELDKTIASQYGLDKDH